MMIIPAMLMGIAVALLRRPRTAAANGSPPDGPAWLLRWATGLLSGPRDEWGQAMLGELDCVEGRGRRWRFAIGCLSAALRLPSWGPASAAVLALVGGTMVSLGLYASITIRHGLGASSWVSAAVPLAMLVSFVIAASVLLRRPRVAWPGLLGGAFVGLAWLTSAGFSFYGAIAPKTDFWTVPVLLFAVPAAVGVAGTLSGGSELVGRQTARLAAICAGVILYLQGTLAVAVLGAGEPPYDSGWTAASIIADRLGNNVVFDLVLIPLATLTFGWVGAAATARLRPQLATHVGPVRLEAPGRHPTLRFVVVWTLVAIVVVLAAAGWLRG